MFSTNNQIHGSVDYFLQRTNLSQTIKLQTEYQIFQTTKLELFTRNTDEY